MREKLPRIQPGERPSSPAGRTSRMPVLRQGSTLANPAVVRAAQPQARKSSFKQRKRLFCRALVTTRSPRDARAEEPASVFLTVTLGVKAECLAWPCAARLHGDPIGWASHPACFRGSSTFSVTEISPGDDREEDRHPGRGRRPSFPPTPPLPTGSAVRGSDTGWGRASPPISLLLTPEGCQGHRGRL